MKDSFPFIFLALILAVVTIIAGIVQLRMDVASERVCRTSCFPFVHTRVQGVCYCSTPEGDLRRADNPEGR
jgi:hypothetical protein